jgi:hypothetical protein
VEIVDFESFVNVSHGGNEVFGGVVWIDEDFVADCDGFD